MVAVRRQPPDRHARTRSAEHRYRESSHPDARIEM